MAELAIKEEDPLAFIADEFVIITSLPIFISPLVTCGEDERFEDASILPCVLVDPEDFGFV